MNTHNLCFRAEIRKIMNTPCKPQFYYIKVGFKGGQNYIVMLSLCVRINVLINIVYKLLL